MPEEEAKREEAAPVETYAAFELFGLSWVPRAVSWAEWEEWSDLPTISRRIEALKAMFVDPPWAAFVAQVPAREFEAAIIQLWGAVRLPPDEGNA